MTVTALTLVPVCGALVDCARLDARVLVSVRGVCAALDLAHEHQLDKLRSFAWARVDVVMVRRAGQVFSLALIDLESLAAWLTHIRPARLTAHSSRRLLRFQREAAGVIRGFFFELQPRRHRDREVLVALAKAHSFPSRSALLKEARRRGVRGRRQRLWAAVNELQAEGAIAVERRDKRQLVLGVA